MILSKLTAGRLRDLCTDSLVKYMGVAWAENVEHYCWCLIVRTVMRVRRLSLLISFRVSFYVFLGKTGVI